jgi:hypothetical protein
MLLSGNEKGIAALARRPGFDSLNSENTIANLFAALQFLSRGDLFRRRLPKPYITLYFLYKID